MNHQNQESDKVQILLKPIVDEFSKGEINTQDLEQISKAVYRLSQKDKESLWAPITDAKAKEMIGAYQKEFGGDVLMNKSFKLSHRLLSDLIGQQKDLVLKFVQLDVELNLLYQDANDNQNLLIDMDTSMELSKDATEAFRRNFYDEKKGLKPKLDGVITRMFNDGTQHENTRQITIPYKTNFDLFDPKKYKNIVLIPAIDNRTADKDKLHKITFVMYFEEIVPTLAPTTFYDVFSVCPPGNCF